MFLKIRGFVNNESDTLLLVQGCPPIPHLGVESREIQIWKGTEPGLLRARKYRGEVGEEENGMDIHVAITDSPQLVPRRSCRVLPNSLKLAGATCNCHRLSLQPLETEDPVTLNLPTLCRSSALLSQQKVPWIFTSSLAYGSYLRHLSEFL